jgi:hypothetical protein
VKHENWGRSSLVWLREHLGVLCAAAVFVYCVIHAFDPPRLNWGDPGSDYNVMTAGRNFQHYGFLKLHLTPYLLDPASMTAGDRALIYTHYPQLPDLMNGIERTVFGMSQLAQFRLVSLCFSFGALAFVYALVGSYWSRRTAECALALWVVNPLWIQHADYLHHAPYAFFFGAGSVFFLSRYLSADAGGRRRDVALSGVFLFFTFLSSYDFWFFVPLLLAGVVVAHHRRLNVAGLRLLAGLAACALAAIAFKWTTNAWALGGVAGWLNDLRYQVTERSTNDAVKTAYVGGIAPTAYGRIERYFSLLFLAVTAFWIVAPAWLKRHSRPAIRLPRVNPIVVLAAALPFLCLFTELWVEQVYPMLLLVPCYAIACGALVVALMEARSKALVSIGFVLLAALMLNSLDEDVRFKKAFFDPAAIASLKAELDSASVPGQHILVNHVFDGAYRYYFNRFTIALIATPPSRMPAALAYYTDPTRSPSATGRGAVFVQHKHLADEMFDKGYYYVISRYKLWALWANPGPYRPLIDSLVNERDAQLEAAVASRGRKLYETSYYTLWHLDPVSSPADSAATTAGSGAASKDQAHLAKVEGQRQRSAP